MDVESFCRAKARIQEIVGRERMLTGKALKTKGHTRARLKPADGTSKNGLPVGEVTLTDVAPANGGLIRFLPEPSEPTGGTATGDGPVTTEDIPREESADPKKGWRAGYDLPGREEARDGE